MRKIREILSFILSILMLINFINISHKVTVDNIEAENLLRETYAPLEEFVTTLTFSKYYELLLLPDNIKNEKDFIKLFYGKMKEHNAKSFYKDLFIEKNNELYVDPTVYIPTIYTNEGVITKAYIKKKRKLYSILLGINDDNTEELIIKEEWDRGGPSWSKRTNHYIKGDNNEWILDRANGTSSNGFVYTNQNPWNTKWIYNTIKN